MAINNPKTGLFHIDIFGNLKESDEDNYLILGTGKENAENYIMEKIEGESYDSSNINLEIAIKLCNGALKKARTEVFSGWPMDLVIIRKNKIEGYGKKIKEAIESAGEKVLEEIISGLKSG